MQQLNMSVVSLGARIADVVSHTENSISFAQSACGASMQAV